MVSPALHPIVIPVTVAILIGLFAVQRRGTGRVGAVFGPIVAIWFLVLAALGIAGLAQDLSVLAAVWPGYAARFFAENAGHGFAVLAAVFLVVTGGEALYADLGHFGPRPIQIGWFGLVCPRCS